MNEYPKCQICEKEIKDINTEDKKKCTECSEKFKKRSRRPYKKQVTKKNKTKERKDEKEVENYNMRSTFILNNDEISKIKKNLNIKEEEEVVVENEENINKKGYLLYDYLINEIHMKEKDEILILKENEDFSFVLYKNKKITIPTHFITSNSISFFK
jgi:DNA-directed RNA polymerase subunit RPC12/RpoP